MEPIEVNKGHLRRVSVKRGDLIRGVSASSKCDRLNVEWSKQHQWFKYDPDDPLNFAVAWVTYELLLTLVFASCLVPWSLVCVREVWTKKQTSQG